MIYVFGVLLEPEIYSDGGEVALLEGVICESSEEGGFAYGAIPDDDNFE